MGGGEDAVEVVAVGVGDEDLSKVVAAHIVDNATHAAGIELVENIVEQQEGRAPLTVVFEIEELRQFHGDEEGLDLSLRGFSAHAVAVHLQVEVVLVGAVEGVADDVFADTTFAQYRSERAAVAVTLVGDAHRFGCGITESGVEGGKNGLKGFDKFASGGVDHGGIGVHQGFEHIEQTFVERAFLLEEGIALQERFAVANQGFQVAGRGLGDDRVHEFSALLAAARHELFVAGREHHEGDGAHVFAQALIVFVVATQAFALSAFQCARHHIAGVVGRNVLALEHEKVGLVAHAVAVGERGCTFAEREKIDGVEHIGLPHPVRADETIHVRREPKFGLFNVLIVEESELFESHGAKEMSAAQDEKRKREEAAGEFVQK